MAEKIESSTAEAALDEAASALVDAGTRVAACSAAGGWFSGDSNVDRAELNSVPGIVFPSVYMDRDDEGDVRVCERLVIVAESARLPSLGLSVAVTGALDGVSIGASVGTSPCLLGRAVTSGATPTPGATVAIGP